MCISSLYSAAFAMNQLKIYDILTRRGKKDLIPATVSFTNVNSGNTHTVNNYYTTITTNETKTINTATTNITYNSAGKEPKRPNKGKKFDKKA